MKIYKNKFNTLPMQVEENMKNIELIASIIKESYRSDIQLLTTDVSIAISDTNASADTTEGWLIDPIGKIFKITGGDGTNLLIEFFTDIRGPQGPEGTTAIDDDVKSLLKTWSSQKISDKIDVISDKGIYYTFVQPTLVDSQYELNTSDLENPNQYTWQKVNDIIVYIDGDGKVKDIYNCVGIQGDFSKIYLEKVGEIGGKQLYQHNVLFTTSGGGYVCCAYPIINDNGSDFTFSTFAKWLYDNGFRDGDSSPFGANGKGYDGGAKHFYAVYSYDGANINAKIVEGTSYTVTSVSDKVVTI